MNGSAHSPSTTPWARACTWLVAMAILLQAVTATSTLGRNFDPPKSLLLASFVIFTLLIGAFCGEIVKSAVFVYKRAPAIAIPFCIIAIVLTVSTVLSPEPWTAFLGTLQRRQGLVTELTELLVLPIAFIAASSGSLRERTFVNLTLLCGAGVAASAACQSHWFGFLDPTKWNAENFNRVSGAMGSASQLATYLAVLIPITCGILIHSGRQKDWPCFSVAIVVFVLEWVAMTLARGRSGMLGAFAGMFLIIAFQFPVGALARILWRAAFSCIILMVACVILLNIPGVEIPAPIKNHENALGHLLERMSRVSDFKESGGRVRVILGEGMAGALASRPASWLIGHGPDGEWAALAPFDTEERANIDKEKTPQDRPHQFLGERLLAGGVGYAASWLFILLTTIATILHSLQIIRSARKFLILLILGAGGCGAASYFLQGGFALVPMAILMGAAVVPLVLAGLAGVFPRPWADRCASNVQKHWVFVACAGAIVAHFVAGSFGVSMAPERTLILSICGFSMGLLAYRKEGEAPLSAEDYYDPSADGLVLGAACVAVMPFYSYYVFRWYPLPRPMYAAAIVPSILLLIALTLARGRRWLFLGESLAVIAIGASSVWAFYNFTDGAGFDALLDYGPRSNYVSVMLMIVFVASAAGLISAILAARERAPATPSIPPGRSARMPAVLFFTVLLGLQLWMAHRELKSDSLFHAAVQLNRWANDEEGRGRNTLDDNARSQILEFAVEMNANARALLQLARETGTPLPSIGVSVVDRQIPGQRP